MMRCLLVVQITKRPHSGLGGITYLEMSSKLNSIVFREVDRFCGERTVRELGLWETGDVIEELEPRELDGPSFSAKETVDAVGENALDWAAVGADGGTAIRPSGT